MESGWGAANVLAPHSWWCYKATAIVSGHGLSRG